MLDADPQKTWEGISQMPWGYLEKINNIIKYQ